MKREAEEAELSACQQLRLDVEKNRGHRCARLQNADHAALFDDEQATVPSAAIGEEDRGSTGRSTPASLNRGVRWQRRSEQQSAAKVTRKRGMAPLYSDS